MTEYYSIVFSGVSAEKIDYFIKEVLRIRIYNIIGSHFYSDCLGDYEFSDDMDLCGYFSENNTANIFAKTVEFNRTYNNVVCVITSDSNDIEVDCSIAESDFAETSVHELAEWLKSLRADGIITGAEICYDAENNPLFEI
ncbi:MAG: hypothetical protein NC177_09260 [Ruminococcus flavefaciens]|nr:hypothetical protein [Ruminococcus flavefaciens]